MGSSSRLNTISSLLYSALDEEGEYLYEGEMSSYMRSYALDAAMDLRYLFQASPPTAEEIAYCVQVLSDPERIKRGGSKALLLTLRENSRPILDALANSSDPALRIFALETSSASTNPLFYSPLYTSIDLTRRLLEDPDENVRVVALSTEQQTIAHNAAYIKSSLQRGGGNPMLDFLSQILARLEDPSPRVREEAANVLLRCATAVGRETLDLLVARENNPAAREILANRRLPGSST